jgi:hypothetical protein
MRQFGHALPQGLDKLSTRRKQVSRVLLRVILWKPRIAVPQKKTRNRKPGGAVSQDSW